jgi:PAS domain S-box-containing protein
MDAEPIVLPDALLDETLASYRDVLLQEGVRGLVFVPLALDTGVMGKFMLHFNEPHECTQDELEMAVSVAAHVALAVERKRAELECDRIAQRLQAIVDNSATLIYLKDLQGRYVLVNRRYEELCHITRENILGRTDHDIFPAGTANRLLENDRAVFVTGKSLAIEEQVPQENGIHSYISVKFPMADPGGTIAGICCIATDITEHKQLESASRHLAAIVESSDDAIISKDLNGIITSWNKAAERIFGYTAAEAVGQPIAMLTAPDRRDEMPTILARIKEGKRIEHYETRRRRKDGEILDIEITVSPVRDAAGRIVGASKIARNIADRKFAERERALLLSREQEARRTAELLNQVAPRLVAQLDLRKLVEEIADIATALTGAEFGTVRPSVMNDIGESTLRSDDVTRDARKGNRPGATNYPTAVCTAAILWRL